MIESALFFALGFLCAGFLALMIAPAIWRRAVHLTRRRIEASVPLTLNEITAEKDRIRAELAMSQRRLEMQLSEFKTRNAEQMAELARNREELKRLAGERDERSAAVAALEGEGVELRARLSERDEELKQARLQLGEAKQALEERASELNRLNGLFEEATFTASGRQIELVARESEVEKLAEDVSRMKGQNREHERRLSEAEAERKASAEALAAEKRRTGELEREIERMLATIADRDEKVRRQEEELARMRESVASEEPTDEAATEDEGGRRQRLETRLAVLMRENKKLKSRLAEIGQAPVAGSGAGGGADNVLRDRISELAAQVVHMTIMLEGEKSTAARAIAQAAKQPAAADGQLTLADRVRALQQTANSQ